MCTPRDHCSCKALNSSNYWAVLPSRQDSTHLQHHVTQFKSQKSTSDGLYVLQGILIDKYTKPLSKGGKQVTKANVEGWVLGGHEHRCPLRCARTGDGNNRVITGKWWALCLPIHLTHFSKQLVRWHYQPRFTRVQTEVHGV